ncbi:cobalt transporter CbiM [Actibacterium sp. 188UL27-1]|uniref:cobalt transporter CbiM n=1 Tax=Actibacterium sp. 188UL27-1 TaxID=2786961 RepID=UPI001955FAAA|nr:cobalt transporter CbiM [Actibacterium sp. 188UL27-1]
MHIVDGALAAPVVVAGTVLAVAGVARGLRDIPLERIPATGVLAATFFVASLIHVPVGPSSVHLMLNGLAGLVLGWAVFPAVLVGLILQAAFFGFGGLTVLGVNTLIVALPAIAVHLALRRAISAAPPPKAAIWGAVGGAAAIALTACCVALALTLGGDAFIPAAQLVLIAHLPVMLVEAALTGAAIYLMRLVKPELFHPMVRVAA